MFSTSILTNKDSRRKGMNNNNFNRFIKGFKQFYQLLEEILITQKQLLKTQQSIERKLEILVGDLTLESYSRWERKNFKTKSR